MVCEYLWSGVGCLEAAGGDKLEAGEGAHRVHRDLLLLDRGGGGLGPALLSLLLRLPTYITLLAGIQYLIKDLGVSSSSSSCSGLVVAGAGAVTGLMSLPLFSVSSDSSPSSELFTSVEGLSSILTPLD